MSRATQRYALIIQYRFDPYRTIQQEKRAKNLYLGPLFFSPCSSPGHIVAFPVIVAVPVIAAFLYHIWVTFFTYMCLGPSCTVLYSAPANYRVVHLVIFICLLLLLIGSDDCVLCWCIFCPFQKALFQGEFIAEA